MRSESQTLPPDFAERCRTLNARIEAGEPMTFEYIADQLGVSFEFFAGALATYVELVHGVPVTVDLRPSPKSN